MTSKILCIDDNSRNLRILQELLEDEYDLECANSGEEGLSCVERIMPDMILLDVMMPGIDGYSVCRKIKSDPDTASIPIVLVTARTQQEDRDLGKAAGADGYLAKPFDPDVLLDLVENHVAPKADA